MTITVQQFAEKYNGKAVDFDKQYGEQCVDLFNFYNTEVVGGSFIGTPKTNGARDLWEVDSAARAKSYKKLAADVKIQTGDVIIYGPPNGRVILAGKQIFLGHVAISVGNSRVIQQNARISHRTTIDPLNTKYILGILRPLRFIGENSPQKESTDTQNKNKHTIKEGDTFWGIEEKKGIPHGTLQEINPGLDPKALRVGSQIQLPAEQHEKHSPLKTYYTIRPGDTFWGLEDAWNIPHGQLAVLNPKLDPRKLQIGERIRRS